MSTYAIIGGSLWGNRGAEAMIATAVGRVRDRDPDARFLIMSYMPKRDRELVVDTQVAVVDAGPKMSVLVHLPFALMSWLTSRLGLRLPEVFLPRTVRQLRRCRALLDVSGISFHDGRLAVVAYNLVCLWPALLLGVPVVRLSQAMGPFEQPLNRFPARQMMQRAAHTFVRGRCTAEFVEGLGVAEGRWSIAPDVAFAYRSEDSLTSENEGLVSQVVRVMRRQEVVASRPVALVPSSLVLKKTADEGRDYVKLLRMVIAHLHASGHHVLVLPNATRAGVDTLRNNDIVAIDRLRQLIEIDPGGVDPGLITYVDFDLNTASIRTLLDRCELVITSRFHAMVAGLSLGIPTLVLGWSHKYREVLEMFGCEDDAVDFAEADTGLVHMVDRLLEQNALVEKRIRDALTSVIESAEAQFDVLDQLPPSSR